MRVLITIFVSPSCILLRYTDIPTRRYTKCIKTFYTRAWNAESCVGRQKSSWRTTDGSFLGGRDGRAASNVIRAPTTFSRAPVGGESRVSVITILLRYCDLCAHAHAPERALSLKTRRLVIADVINNNVRIYIIYYTRLIRTPAFYVPHAYACTCSTNRIILANTAIHHNMCVGNIYYVCLRCVCAYSRGRDGDTW